MLHQLDSFVSSVWFVVQGFVVHTVCEIKIDVFSISVKFYGLKPLKPVFNPSVFDYKMKHIGRNNVCRAEHPLLGVYSCGLALVIRAWTHRRANTKAKAKQKHNAEKPHASQRPRRLPGYLTGGQSGVCAVVFAHLEFQNTRSPFSIEGTALAQITKYKVREGRV